MSTSYKSLYLKLQEEHINLVRLTTRLMTQHLDDMKNKEASMEATAEKMKSAMTAMASSLQAKVDSKKAVNKIAEHMLAKHKIEVGTPIAK